MAHGVILPMGVHPHVVEVVVVPANVDALLSVAGTTQMTEH
jgi:hypothetical protein